MLGKRKTNKEFLEEAFDLVGNEYEFLEEYKGAMTKIKCRHNNCGTEWNIRPNNFLSGYGCPLCGIKTSNKKRTKTNEQFLQEVHSLVDDEYTFLEPYKNIHTKLKCRYNKCGTKWNIIPDSFLRGTRCPVCATEKRNKLLTKTNEEFVNEVYELVGDEYTFLEEYKGANIKIKCKHNLCNNTYDVTPSKFLLGRRCPRCAIERKARKRRKTKQQFQKEVYELVGDEYIVLGEYINNSTKIKIKHVKCNHEWDVSPANFLKGNRCPQCAETRGEKKIRLYLNKQNINNIPQKLFDDCRNINPLPFDFYLPEYNMLIEYDGELHFIPIEYFGGQEKLEYTQQNDNIKNKYCKTQNIKLLRIPYWEFNNIEQILNDELKVGEEECRKIF